MKWKESLKNLVLVLLIMSSITLTWRIWFSEELWPNGYNSFPYEENVFSSFGKRILSYFHSGTDETLFDYNQLFYPQQMRISNAGSRTLLLPDSPQFLSMNEEVKNALSGFMQDCTIAQVTEDEMKKVYRASSLCVDYHNPFPLSLMAAHFGKALPANLDDLGEIRQLLFVLEDNPQRTILYLTDGEGNYRLEKNGDGSALYKAASETVGSGEELQVNHYPFSFESNFDKLSVATGRRLPIYPYTVIPLLPTPIHEVQAQTLIRMEDSQTASLLNKLVQEFSINIGSSRRFTDSEGAYNYVENFATLKFNPAGLVEYTATNAEKGIDLGQNVYHEYDLLKNVGAFVNLVNSIVPSHNNTLVHHNLESLGKGKYRITFRCMAGGYPIEIRQLLTNGEKLEDFVEVIVEDNHVVSYRQMLVDFTVTDTVLGQVSAIEAMDGFYNRYQDTESGAEIEKFYPTYFYTDGAVVPQWTFRLSGNEKISFPIFPKGGEE